MGTDTVVVLGGSFNPCTLAHRVILERAMDAVGADLGIIVPSSDNYVKHKMSKKDTCNMVYTQDERYTMLELLISDSSKNIVIDTIEYGDDGKGHTYRTLSALDKKYKASKMYFILGTDNLAWMCKWRDSEKLFSTFYFVVIARNGEQPWEVVEENETLSKYKDHFVFMEQPVEIDGISSTLVRERVESHQGDIDELLGDKVTEYIKGLNR